MPTTQHGNHQRFWTLAAAYVGGVLLIATTAFRSESPGTGQCIGSTVDSDPVAFSRINTEQSVEAEDSHIKGPELRAIARTDSDWVRVWRAAVGSIPVPHVSMRDSIIVLVASRTFVSSPYSFEIESVRRCRSDSTIAVLVRLHSGGMSDFHSRSIHAVQIARTVELRRIYADGRAFHFIDLPDVPLVR